MTAHVPQEPAIHSFRNQ